MKHEIKMDRLIKNYIIRVIPLRVRCFTVLRKGFVRTGLSFLIIMLLSQGYVFAKKKKPPPPDISTLLSEDDDQWLSALDEMRVEIEGSRKKLVLNLQSDLVSENRWRIYHHLSEFGRTEDIPLLLEILEKETTVVEKQVILGAVRSLYEGGANQEVLSFAVEEFSFVRTSDPKSLDVKNLGKLVISKADFAFYHRQGIPMGVLNKIMHLRGRAFSNVEDLSKALEKELGEDDWKTYQDQLLILLEPVQDLISIEGLLRVQVRNPLPRPLLLRIEFNTWAGRFDAPPAPLHLYIEPEQVKRSDLAVKIIKVDNDRPVRVDLRMKEVNGSFIPLFQKLYISR